MAKSIINDDESIDTSKRKTRSGAQVRQKSIQARSIVDGTLIIEPASQWRRLTPPANKRGKISRKAIIKAIEEVMAMRSS
jgi:hypothetical protein